MDRPRGAARLRALIGFNGTRSAAQRSMVSLLGATALAQVIALAVSPVLTRLTGPAAFGVFGVYLAALGVLGAVASLRFGLAVPLAETDEEAAAVVVAGALGAFALAGVAALVVFCFGEWIASVVLETAGDGLLLWLVPAGMLGVGLTDVLSGWCMRRREFRPLVRSRITRSVGTSACQLAGGVLVRGSPIGLIGGDVLGRLVSVMEMTRIIARDERGRALVPSIPRVRTAFSRYRAFALISTPSTFINAAGAWAPVILLTLWWGPVAGGLYTLGQRVIGVPIGLLGDSAGQVYISELAAGARGSSGAMTELFSKTARGLLTLGIPAAVAMAVLGPLVFRTVFGAQWADAGVMVRWQAFALACQLVAIPLAQTLNVLGYQRQQLAWDVARLTLTVAGFAGAHHSGLTAVESVAIYGVITAATYLVLIALGWRAIRETAAVGNTKLTIVGDTPP